MCHLACPYHRSASRRLVPGAPVQVSAAPSPLAGAAVQRVLDLARTQLGMDVAWVSRLTALGAGLPAGRRGARPPRRRCPAAPRRSRSSYCVRVLDGRLPGVVPDARRDPRTRDLPGTRELEIGAYVGAPVRAEDGSVTGMLCCTSRRRPARPRRPRPRACCCCSPRCCPSCRTARRRPVRLRRRVADVLGGDRPLGPAAADRRRGHRAGGRRRGAQPLRRGARSPRTCGSPTPTASGCAPRSS